MTSLAGGKKWWRLLPLFVLPLLAASADDTEKAQLLLEKAELRIEQSRYADAVAIYRDLARRYPTTKAGRVGERRSRSSAYIGSTLLIDSGPSDNRVDVALMGDGYPLRNQKAFDKLANDIPPLFERQKTFREYFNYLNFLRLNLVSHDRGVDGFGREYDTALNGHTTGTIQGHVSVDARLVREALEETGAHDNFAIVFVHAGVLGVGGGGIATIGGRSAKTTVHEWGHAFAGLGDEYSSKTHDRGKVQKNVNVSDTDDPEKVPWAHFIKAKVPGVGVYEGASGQVRGAWRPTASGCIMANGEFFCPPCREALILRIYSLVDPIESTNFPVYPLQSPASLTIEDSQEFEVKVMQPKSHNLEVSWWILPERSAPPEPRGSSERYSGRYSDRRSRGPLSKLQHEPVLHTRTRKDGVHKLKIKARELDPGRYRVICRAVDTTKLRGDRFPWVLKDEHGLLESERAWWIVIPEK